MRIPSVTVLSQKKNRYCYRRLVFKDLPDLDSLAAIYVDFYYNGDVNYEAKPYGTLCIWSENYQNRSYKLDKETVARLAD